MDRQCVGGNVINQSFVILPLCNVVCNPASDVFFQPRLSYPQSPMLDSWAIGWRHERERPQDQSVYMTLLENRVYSVEHKEHKEVWDRLTAAGDSFFSRWRDLIIRIEIPPFCPFCQEHVRRWNPVYGWMDNTVCATKFNGVKSSEILGGLKENKNGWMVRSFFHNMYHNLSNVK